MSFTAQITADIDGFSKVVDQAVKVNNQNKGG